MYTVKLFKTKMAAWTTLLVYWYQKYHQVFKSITVWYLWFMDQNLLVRRLLGSIAYLTLKKRRTFHKRWILHVIRNFMGIKSSTSGLLSISSRTLLFLKEFYMYLRYICQFKRFSFNKEQCYLVPVKWIFHSKFWQHRISLGSD